MSKIEKVELTNMCMVYDDGNILVQDRIDKSGAALPFPAVILKTVKALLMRLFARLKKKQVLI